MFLKRTLSLSNLTLLVALSLSSVAAYYSIIGLTAIFAGAVIPIIVMGSILEVGKITTTVWLRKYWNRCSWLLKAYLVPAVVLLALLTSMGIFGFLSKAHMDQGLVSGDSQAKLSLYDEKIKTQRDNIDVARKALQQMDAQVDARLSRGDSENGAERAVAIRRQQAGERAKLQKEIGEAQKEIAKLNEERAPIAAENRKVEAEVGPVKYIAALIYGDNTDQNMLEAAVRWVIILLVVVFDPLAIALVLAANASKEWDDENKPDAWVADVTMPGPGPGYEPDDGPLTDDQIEQIKESGATFTDFGEHPKDKFEYEEVKEETPISDKHPYLKMPFVHFKNNKPLVYKEEPTVKEPTEVVYNDEKLISNIDKKILAVGIDAERPGDYLTLDYIDNTYVVKAEETPYPWTTVDDEYVMYEGKMMRFEVLKSLKPELFMLTADHNRDIKTSFGSSFPKESEKGDMFVRADLLPNRVFKYDGNRWIEINKEKTDTYLYNDKYVNYLVNKISSGEYDVEFLTENERAHIEEYINAQKS